MHNVYSEKAYIQVGEGAKRLISLSLSPSPSSHFLCGSALNPGTHQHSQGRYSVSTSPWVPCPAPAAHPSPARLCVHSQNTLPRVPVQTCSYVSLRFLLLPNLYLIYRVMLMLEGTGKPWRICSFRWMPGKLFVGLWGSSHATGRTGASYRLSDWTSGPHLLRPATQHHLSCHWICPSSHLSPQHQLLGPAPSSKATPEPE